MKLACLCWYIGGMLGVLSVATVFVTVAPELEPSRFVIYSIAGLSGLLICGLGFILLRLPAKHWVHRSKPIWAAGLAIAATVTFAVLVLG